MEEGLNYLEAAEQKKKSVLLGGDGLSTNIKVKKMRVAFQTFVRSCTTITLQQYCTICHLPGCSNQGSLGEPLQGEPQQHPHVSLHTHVCLD